MAACGITDVNSSVLEENPYSNPFFARFPKSSQQNRKSSVLNTADDSGVMLVGGRRTALVVLTYNRAQYLLQTMTRVSDVLQSHKFRVDVFVAIDGDDEVTDNMVLSIKDRMTQSLPSCMFNVIQNKRVLKEGETDYNAIARNIRNALEVLTRSNEYDQVIIMDVR